MSKKTQIVGEIEFYTQQAVERELYAHLDAVRRTLRIIEHDDTLSNWMVDGNISLFGQFCSLTCAYMLLRPGVSPSEFILQALDYPHLWHPGRGTTWKGLLEYGELGMDAYKGIAMELRTSAGELLKRRDIVPESAGTFFAELRHQRDLQKQFLMRMQDAGIPVIASVARHLDHEKLRGHQVVVLGIGKNKGGKECVILFDPDEEADYSHHADNITKDGDVIYISYDYWEELSHGIYLFWISEVELSLLSPFAQFYKTSDQLYFPKQA